MMKRADTDMLVVVLKAFLGATAVKLLLAVPGGYRSTDFDVHANWLALTHGRPVKEWYWDETSQWTLDYPPLFAYFQRVLAVLAEALSIDPALLQQYENPPVWSSAAEGFLRGTVLASDATLFVGLAACIHGINGHAFKGEFIAKEAPGVLALMLFFNSGLLMVDHIHFQYNGILLGILLLSIGLVTQRRHILAGVTFALLLMMKHLFLCIAPVYFVYLLRAYCWDTTGRWIPLSAVRLAGLGGSVLASFSICVAPLCTGSGCLAQLQQLGRRLFPIQRGLVHAYWAANVWSLYLFGDRLLLLGVKLLHPGALDETLKASTTGGLVQSAQLAVLPSITPLLSLILVLAAQSPALVMVWRCPTPKMFVWGVIHCSLSAFMLGWHVHEKAILITIIPLTLLAVCHPACPSTQRLFCRLCGAGHFALMPLLLGPDLVLIKTLLWMGYLVLVWTLLGCPPTGLDWLQFSSLALTWLFCEVLHPIISNGAAGRWPFLPLMATSVVCALWLLVCWGEGLLLMRADFRKEVLAASRKKA